MYFSFLRYLLQFLQCFCFRNVLRTASCHLESGGGPPWSMDHGLINTAIKTVLDIETSYDSGPCKLKIRARVGGYTVVLCRDCATEVCQLCLVLLYWWNRPGRYRLEMRAVWRTQDMLIDFLRGNNVRFPFSSLLHKSDGYLPNYCAHCHSVSASLLSRQVSHYWREDEAALRDETVLSLPVAVECLLFRPSVCL
jgi:hypothetical protein